ncbi:hypothetical protein Bca101_081772 [Brassica carinata]
MLFKIHSRRVSSGNRGDADDGGNHSGGGGGYCSRDEAVVDKEVEDLKIGIVVELIVVIVIEMAVMETKRWWLWRWW